MFELFPTFERQWLATSAIKKK